MLVRDGAPVYRANEAFTTSQLAPRGPRTAVGQRADGGVLLVTTDGRQPGYSVGMTNFELAQTLVRLGAVRGMALDGGGSSTLAFEGTVLNSPSDGRERAVSTALMLQYFGVYAPPPLEAVVSPNGDGVAEEQKLSFKVVRPSTVTVTLTAPDGIDRVRRRPAAREPGTLRGCLSTAAAASTPAARGRAATPADRAAPAGRGALDAQPSTATDDQGLASSTTPALRRQLDARLPARRARCASSSARRAAGRDDPLDAGARRAREGDGRDDRGRRRPNVVAPRRFEAGEQAVAWDGAAGKRQARRGRALRRSRDGDERARRRVARRSRCTVRRVAGK